MNELPRPYLSVIIPARNSADTLAPLLDQLAQALDPDCEVIIVDDRSTDGTAELVARYPVRRVPLTGGRGPAAGRNLGVREARGEVIMFMDDDVVIKDRGLLAGVIRRFQEDPRLTMLSTLSEKRPENAGFLPAYTSLQEWVIYHRYVTGAGDQYFPDFTTRCGAMRRAVFEQAGGFDEKFQLPSVEDADLFYRIAAVAPLGIVCPGYQIGHHWPQRFSRLMRAYITRSRLWIRLFAGRKQFDDVFSTRREALAKISDGAMLLFLLLGLLFPPLWFGAAACAGMSAYLGRDLLEEARREYGTMFALKAFVVHALASAALLTGAAWGCLDLLRDRLRARGARNAGG